MGGTWTVSTEIGFCASHCLAGHQGVCANVHGHNWIVRVHYLFESIDRISGIGVDFLELRAGLERVVLPRFDHRHLNEVSPFDKVAPTSENLAAEIFRLCSEELRYEGGRLVEVEVRETPADRVCYRG